MRRVFFDTERRDDRTTTTTIDDNLKLFNFNFPTEYADLMHGYYLADLTSFAEFCRVVH